MLETIVQGKIELMRDYIEWLNNEVVQVRPKDRTMLYMLEQELWPATKFGKAVGIETLKTHFLCGDVEDCIHKKAEKTQGNAGPPHSVDKWKDGMVCDQKRPPGCFAKYTPLIASTECILAECSNGEFITTWIKFPK
jgi:hypothetical protein